MVSLPAWAISDEDALKLTPEEGWIHDYVHYMREATDCPIIYHLGAAYTVLSSAASKSDIQIPHSGDKVHEIPTTIWSLIIGSSGDRKSQTMKTAVDLLCRAKRLTPDRTALLPADGTLEAWIDIMAGNPKSDPPQDGHPDLLLHYDEAAFLFDQAKRGYMEGMRSWLCAAYSGQIPQRATRENREPREIARPRLAMIGGIPPAILKEKLQSSDWGSGFLPRMALWGGRRMRRQFLPGQNKATEDKLVTWLARTPLTFVDGILRITEDDARVMDVWMNEHVEAHRDDVKEDLFSLQQRYQDLGFKFAAMAALSRVIGEPGNLVRVQRRDVELAVETVAHLHVTNKVLYSATSRSAESEDEQSCLDALSLNEWRYIEDVHERVPGWSRSKLRRLLKTLGDGEDGPGLVKVKSQRKPGSKGRPSILYKLR